MMERGSRFISLSGLSGMAAGLIAIIGAWIAARKIGCWKIGDCLYAQLNSAGGEKLLNELFVIAGATFLGAFVAAFFFTWLRSRKTNVPIWGPVARRVMWSVAIPIATGAFFLYAMAKMGQYDLIVPGCFFFYGLGLISASKYTVSEIRWLGYAQLIMGVITTRLTGYGLQCWAIGFGGLHIIYGAVMWWKYERQEVK